jgi:hypothetical protein
VIAALWVREKPGKRRKRKGKPVKNERHAVMAVMR